MAVVGGPLETISIAGRSFEPAGDVDVNIFLGGKRNTVEPGGNGGSRLIKNVMACGAEGCVVHLDDDNADLEYLQAQADLNDFFEVVLTKASGIAYGGLAQIEELDSSSANATATFNLKGTGKWQQL